MPRFKTTRWLALFVSLSIATPFAAPALAQTASASTTAGHLKKGKEQFGKKLYNDARSSFAAA